MLLYLLTYVLGYCYRWSADQKIIDLSEKDDEAMRRVVLEIEAGFVCGVIEAKLFGEDGVNVLVP